MLKTLVLVLKHLAEQLKKNGVEFLDAAGNAFINRPPLFIHIKGNRLPEHLKPATPRRTFRQAGLKVIYAFLCNPGLENQTYRQIVISKASAILFTAERTSMVWLSIFPYKLRRQPVQFTGTTFHRNHRIAEPDFSIPNSPCYKKESYTVKFSAYHFPWRGKISRQRAHRVRADQDLPMSLPYPR
ncbi:MAG: hypothetical protein HYS21_12570 [Deltaproteobacteria bacterium]|nr:hypothetical protein [Deltaproteobacteria bacterium]